MGTDKSSDASLARIRLRQGNGIRYILPRDNETVMDALIRYGVYINAVCGGKGRCGKCKVKTSGTDIPVSAADRAFFSAGELDDGWRLSCALHACDGLEEISVENDDGFEIITEHADITAANGGSGYAIGIDIGTTTIAFCLLDRSSGRVCGTTSEVNRQRIFGADVISRIQAASEGKGGKLGESIKNDLKNGILRLCRECKITADKISSIAVAANTAMTHLLMGYDCSSLGRYPFKPVNIDMIRVGLNEITGIPTKTETVILPGISAYIGADIVSGMYACDFDKTDDICLLVDLGTNGEMALGNRHGIIAASSAAGPAFEGGSISCGMGSVEGAICSVSLDGEEATVRTIKDKQPIGICGTGVIEAVAELLREGMLDKTGLLRDDLFECGFLLCADRDGSEITLTQKDIREIQLAKAAVRTGIEILIREYGITKEQVSKIYIAGGFGYRLDASKAIAIGMIPPEFDGRIEAVGNTSLAGALKFLNDPNGSEMLTNIVSVAKEISLPQNADFNELYMKFMSF